MVTGRARRSAPRSLPVTAGKPSSGRAARRTPTITEGLRSGPRGTVSCPGDFCIQDLVARGRSGGLEATAGRADPHRIAGDAAREQLAPAEEVDDPAVGVRPARVIPAVVPGRGLPGQGHTLTPVSVPSRTATRTPRSGRRSTGAAAPWEPLELPLAARPGRSRLMALDAASHVPGLLRPAMDTEGAGGLPGTGEASGVRVSGRRYRGSTRTRSRS